MRITPKQAEEMIDQIRALAAAGGRPLFMPNTGHKVSAVPVELLREVLLEAGLAPLRRCDGEVHDLGPDMTCPACAGRRGAIGVRASVEPDSKAAATARRIAVALRRNRP